MQVAEHSAWYSGDPDTLKNFYGRAGEGLVQRRGWFRRFWRRAGQRQTSSSQSSATDFLHIPVAGDLAATSADLLFSETPSFTVPEDSGTSANAQLDQVLKLFTEGGIHNTLLEAADAAAGLGGVYLRPMWDREIVDRPVLTIVHQDSAIPEFRFGILTAVTIWQEVEQNGEKVLRYLERHERDGQGAVILHGLYEGTRQALGTRIPLTDNPLTAGIAGSLTDGDRIEIPEEVAQGRILIRYVPNQRPNRRFRRSYLGRSDLEGVEGLMDSLDEVWSSWMRDIRLGVARILVAEEYLERGFGSPSALRGFAGQEARFNADQEVFVPMSIDPTARETSGIEPIQFEIRTEAHMQTAVSLIDEIVSKAGYSPSTFRPVSENTAESGRALRLRERRSFRTSAKKERYWVPEVEDIMRILVALDRWAFDGEGNPGDLERVHMTFGDVVEADVRELADTAQALSTAEAASIETRVRMVHPDWAEEDIEQEVAKIQAESSISMPTPNGAPEPEEVEDLD